MSLHYAGAGDLEALLQTWRGHVLGVVAFGVPAAAPEDIPFVTVDMPVLGAKAAYEVWATDAPVKVAPGGAIASANDAQVLFGCMELPDDDRTSYAATIYQNYCRIFDHLDRLGFPKLLRVWHYLPDIHCNHQELERYRQFSVGRHDAFVARGRMISADAPAASAVGKGSGNTIICFLAAARAGTPIENPCQISAYAYPQQYGPRAPTFSRALLRNAQLYVSGTAAILGHASQHEGDVEAQTDLTIGNLRAVMQQARGVGSPDAACGHTDLSFKIYVRKPEYRALAQAKLGQAFGDRASTLFLQADICRRELLLEIEAFCAAGAPAA